MPTIPVSMVMATRDRPEVLARTWAGFAKDTPLPSEVVLVDSSAETRSGRALLETAFPSAVRTIFLASEEASAATQRNLGTAHSTQPYVFYADDDILPETGCLENLWKALDRDPALGGVNAMITNQQYETPGRLSSLLFTWFAGQPSSTPWNSWAGRCLGPARNLLPRDAEDLPEVVPVEWLNTTCTLYRREALPVQAPGPFDDFFHGASICEDLALSLRVAQNWELANVRTARIYHDSQGGSHKSRAGGTVAMNLRNRHYILTQILHCDDARHLCQLGADTLFDIAGASASIEGLRLLPERLLGWFRGVGQVLKDRSQ